MNSWRGFTHTFDDPRWKRKMFKLFLMFLAVIVCSVIVMLPIYVVCWGGSVALSGVTASTPRSEAIVLILTLFGIAVAAVVPAPIVGWFVELTRSEERLLPEWRPFWSKVASGLSIGVAGLMFGGVLLGIRWIGATVLYPWALQWDGFSVVLGVQMVSDEMLVVNLVTGFVVCLLFLMGFLQFIETNRFWSFFNLKRSLRMLFEGQIVLLLLKLAGLLILITIVVIVFSAIEADITARIDFELWRRSMMGKDAGALKTLTVILGLIMLYIEFAIVWLAGIMPASYYISDALFKRRRDVTEVASVAAAD
jgi:hypothetical protein